MIKILKSKFFICLFLLVTIFSVASSCYAYSFNTNTIYEDVYLDLAKENVTIDLDNLNYRIICFYDSYYAQYCYFFIYEGEESSEGLFDNTYTKCILESGQYRHKIYNSSGNVLNFYYQSVTIYSTGTIRQVFGGDGSLKSYYTSDGTGSKSVYYVVDSTEIDYYSNGNLVYDAPERSVVKVIHEFQSDTSAKVIFTLNNVPDGSILKYSLSGVEISTDLTEPLQLRNPVTYTPRSNKLSCKTKYKSILGFI